MAGSGKLGIAVMIWLAALAARAAADGSVLLGYVFDPTVAGIRAVEGVPGAARLGAALPVGDFFWSATVAPHQNYALATAETGLVVVRFGGDGSAPSEAPLAAAPPAVDMLAFNASGSAAALYCRAQASVIVVSGLPDAPALARSVDVSGLPAPLVSLALGDDGNTLLAGSSDGANGAVYRFDAEGNAQAVLATPHPAAVLFRGADAVIADDQAHAVTMVRDPAGAAQATVLAGPPDGVSGPLALALTSAGLVLAAQPSGVLVLDPDGGAPAAAIACPCLVAGLDHTTDAAAFRLTGASAAPMWMLDLGGGGARVVFVPPAAISDGPRP